MARHFKSFEIKALEQNPNVLRVSDRSITYHPEFKIRAVEAHEQGFNEVRLENGHSKLRQRKIQWYHNIIYGRCS